MDFKTFKQKLFENPDFREVYEDKSDLSFEISEMVEEARVKAGLTQAKLAEIMGTQQSSIARIESGTTLPSMSFLQKVAEALGTYLISPKFASLETAETETQIFTTWIDPGMYEVQGKVTPLVEFNLDKSNICTESIKNI